MKLGERLRYIRELREKTQVQLAEAAGIEQSSVSDLETGKSKTMLADTLMAMCDFLRVRPDWLYREKGAMEYSPGYDLSPQEVKLILAYRNVSSPPVAIERREAERRVPTDDSANPWLGAGGGIERRRRDRRINGSGANN